MGGVKGISPADVRQKVINIENKLSSSSITPSAEKQLFGQLDKVQSYLEELQKKGIPPFLEDLSLHIRTLYGMVHDQMIRTKVTQLMNTADILEKDMKTNKNMTDVTAKILRLERKIGKLRKLYALDRQTCGQLKLRLAKIKNFLKDNLVDKTRT